MSRMPLTFSIVVLTCHRDNGGYLEETLANLKRAGVQSHPHCSAFQVVEFPGLSSKEASIKALECTLKTPASFSVFMEDDIDVISDFLSSLEAWLHDVEGLDHLFFPLGAAYQEVSESRGIAWEYPLKKFYGTQAFAIRQSAVPALIHNLKQHPGEHDQSFDLAIAQVLPCRTVLTPVPSFVQHTGRHSAIHPGRFHSYDSWPGKGWSYVKRSSVMSPAEQKHHNYFSKAAFEGMLQFLNREFPIYDMGCGNGQYVRAFLEAGFDAYGYEGVPGAARLSVLPENRKTRIFEADLTRPLPPASLPGSVISLEVAEHIPAPFEAVFLDNLVRFCKDTIVLSWASPGQGGCGHVNERPKDHVVQVMQSREFELDEATTVSVTSKIDDVSWLQHNLMVFRRKP